MTTRLTHLRRPGLTFDVLDTGPADGAVVVLLHGFPQRASSWTPVAARLRGRGLRTVALDQRGYSAGARPRGRPAYAADRLVGDVVALVDALGGGPVHLAGHDWGATVAWWLAAARPDLVRTLTTVSVPHPRAFLASLPRGQALRSWYLAAFQVPLLPERALASRRVATRLLGLDHVPASVATTYWRDVVDAGALGPALGWYRALPLGAPADFARRVRVPTTHVWSTGDPALGRAGAELTGACVRAPYELVVLEGVSHWVLDEAPDALAEAIGRRVAAPVRPRDEQA